MGWSRPIHIGVCGEHLLWSHTSQKLHHLWSPCSFTAVVAHTNIEVPYLLEAAFHIVALASNIFRNLEFVVQYENLTRHYANATPSISKLIVFVT